MKLSTLITGLAVAPCVLLFGLGLWNLRDSNSDSIEGTSMVYGYGVAKSTAILLQAQNRTFNPERASEVVRDVLNSNPGIVGLVFFDRSGNRILSVNSKTADERSGPHPLVSTVETTDGSAVALVDPVAVSKAFKLGPSASLLYRHFLTALLVFVGAGGTAAHVIWRLRQLRHSIVTLGLPEPPRVVADREADPEFSTALNSTSESIFRRRLEDAAALEKMASREISTIKEIQSRNAEIRTLFGNFDQQVEAERRSIALDIHDQVNASAVVLRDAAERINKLVTSPEYGTAEVREQITRKVRDVINANEEIFRQARGIVRRIRPELIEVLGIQEAIRDMVKQLSDQSTDCRYIFAGEIPEGFFTEDQALVAYRIVQEALSNISKHSSATNVEITFDLDDNGDELTLAISDNGNGFAVEEAMGRTSFGLIGMRERAANIGAELTIESKKGRGTTVALHFKRAQNPATH